ncbi:MULTISPECIES: amino acid permease [Neobacillus]|uniref:Amino acid permease n=1 Tax=Neobacillus rhizophilus TaxID=2833579 RepID=A0A942U2H8_9BACI|nr:MULTISPECIES: amino acid permease [Neobacillus]MBS4213400.1 amino acid permease [Neobacillus rhizophilus]
MGKSTSGSKETTLRWWQLSLFGIGCTIGTGFFLGSSLAIKMAGPSILIAYLIAALGTYLVFDALSKMTAKEPLEGGFRSYAKKAYGRWAGFSSGWVYWCSEVLIMGSQMTALSIFSRFWFPNIPLWVFAAVYAILGLAVILIGVGILNKLENVLAVLKVAAILMFIIIALLAIFGVIDGDRPIQYPNSKKDFFPGGMKGLWSAVIFAYYAFGGIEILGLMATKLKDPKEAPKAGRVMLFSLMVIYALSIGIAVTMVNWQQFNAKESPFVIALDAYNLSFVPHIFNGALIIAGFSTMAASLYGVTSVLVTLAKEGDAPASFAKEGKLKIPLPTLILTMIGITASVLSALLMPNRIYEYITTAAGLMLLYNWMFILASPRKILKITAKDKIKYFLGILLILIAVSGTLFHTSSRPGFFISIAFVGVIGAITLIMRVKWKRSEKNKKKTILKPWPTA